MEIKQLIAMLSTTNYKLPVEVTKNNRTNTIVDTSTKLVLSFTLSSINPDRLHCYFKDQDDKCWTTDGLNRTILNNNDFDIKTLPEDWDEDDLLVMNNNKSMLCNADYVLATGFNYFAPYFDYIKNIQNGINLHAIF
jgi:hypothetical protein